MAALLPILAYHGVRVDKTDRYAVAPALLREHLTVLVESGYTSVSLLEGMHALRAGTLPERSVVVTVDDGYADFASAALDVFNDFDIKGSVFVPTAHIGAEDAWMARWNAIRFPLMSHAQIADVAAAGWDVGVHSASHIELDRANNAALQTEIGDAKHALEDALRRDVSTFAYPFGYANAKVRRAVKAAGYELGCSVSNRSASPRDEMFEVPRFEIRSDMSGADVLSLIQQPRTLQGDVVASLKNTVWRQCRRLSSLRAAS
jgi:peptidoglycan/xylan/chitin deacetylase (PgdA/CDA1 family)